MITGLDLTGRAKGLLLEWQRSARGAWLGVVNYELHYIDRRNPTMWLYKQLVPVRALCPRD